jgi:hypothetical protein
MRLRGYSMLVVFLVLGVLTVSITSLVAYVQVSNQTKASSVQRIRSFYVCDGVQRMIGNVADDYFSKTLTPSKSGLIDALRPLGSSGPKLTLSSVMPPGYSAHSVDLKSLTPVGSLPILVRDVDGHTDGSVLFGNQMIVSSDVDLRRDDLDYGCAISNQISVTKLSPLQFQIFDARAQAPVLGTSVFPLFVTGGLYADDAIAYAGGTSGIWLRGLVKANMVGLAPVVTPLMGPGPVYVRLERSKRGIYGDVEVQQGLKLLPSVPAGCADPAAGVRLPGAPATSSTWEANMVPDPVVGVTACDGTRLAEQSTSPLPTQLLLPGQFTSTAATVPRVGKEGLGGFPTVPDGNENIEGMRFLVDPPHANDSALQAARKFARLADILIIDGIWYVRDGSSAWPTRPGLPVWSDHPGHFAEVAGGAAFPTGVGQEDLRTDRGWTSTPRRFSHYATRPELPVDPEGRMLRPITGGASPTHVVSYGKLCHIAGKDVPCDLHAGDKNRQRTGVLSATKVGFRDAIWEGGHPIKTKLGVSDILPINIDLQALAAALADTSKGELGSYFIGRPFNGILWVGSTWPNAWDYEGPGDGAGLQVPFATPVDIQTGIDWARDEAFDPPPSPLEPVLNRALPHPLCMSDLTTDAPAKAHLAAFAPRTIYAPPCVTQLTHPTAVRLVNGDFEPEQFPNGLTVASHLPVYVLGDLNAKSKPDDSVLCDDGGGEPRYRSWGGSLKRLRIGDCDDTQFGHILDPDEWTPVLLAGDTITIQSNDWRDDDWPWLTEISKAAAASPAARASDTTIVASFISGNAVGNDLKFGGLLGAIRTLERWSDANTKEFAAIHLRGSLIVAHGPVYARGVPVKGLAEAEGPTAANAAGYVPFLDFIYDEHLDSSSPGLPPGAPIFSFTYTRAWQRR